MKIRWMLLAVGLAVAMTAVAALSMRSAGDPGTAAAGATTASVMPASATEGAGCPVKAKPANLNFTLKDMYGRDVKLADYRGKVVLLNFWATWCGPCTAEIPGFVDLQAKYKKRGLEILGVSVSDSVADLQPFASRFKINYPLLVGLDHDDLMEAYGAAVAIPVTVLIARNGTVCDRHLAMVDLEQVEREIKSLL